MTDPGAAVRKEGPHPVVLRELRVVRSERLGPRMIRVTLGGEQLTGFASPSPDDHVTLFFLADGQQVPTSDDPSRRPIWAVRPPTRDYTPRAYRADVQELDLDFVLHGTGVASAWAEAARAGDRIAVSGPRTSLVAEGFGHHLVIGDDTALPAIARRLEELPVSASAQVFVEVQTREDELPLPSPATTDITWIHRGELAPGTPDLLLDAVRSADLVTTDAYAAVAAETDVVRRLRHLLLAERGLTPGHTRFSGYWKLGRT